MFISTEIRRAVDDARAVLADPKPLHAVAGAGDLVVERVRSAAAAQQKALQAINFEPSAVPARVNATVDTVREAIAGLPERAQDAIVGSVVKASIAYEDLAQRGAKLVKRVRGQRASQVLADQVENTVRAAKATSTTVRTAGASTTSRAKATATSARNAASAAGAAVTAAAAKTGTTGAASTTRAATNGSAPTSTAKTTAGRKTTATARATVSTRKAATAGTRKATTATRKATVSTKKATAGTKKAAASAK